MQTVDRIIVVGWDGVQLAHMRDLLAAGDLPNLSAMIARGSMVSTTVTNHASDTKAGWTQIFTGYRPKITGVISNSFYAAIPQGYTLFERAREHYAASGKDFRAVGITGKDENIGSGVGFPFEHCAKTLDVWEGDLKRDADEVGALALQALDQHGTAEALVAFIHFGDPDHAGHKRNENSQEYDDAIVLCDQWLGRLVDKVNALGIADETRIFVTTDHGFDEGQKTHNDAPDTWFVSDRTDVNRDANQDAVAPTLYGALGIDYTKYRPRLEGRPLVR